MSEPLSEDSSKVLRLDIYPLEGKRPLEDWLSAGCCAPDELGKVGEDRLGGWDIRLDAGDRGGVGGGVGGPSVSHAK